MQKQYIGVKLVLAQPMTRGEFHASTKNPAMLSTDQATEDGYEVEYLDGGKPNIDGRDGYVSWCPEEQFEKANRPTDGMSFGLALEALKQGSRIARKGWNGKGWNGKGMWLAYMSGMSLPPYNTQDTDRKVNDRTAKWIGEDTPLHTNAYIAMWTSDEKWQPGWLASQSDMLADDWVIVS